MKHIPLLLLAILLFAPSHGWCNNTKLVVGVSTGYPPYYFKENDKLVGLCIDLVNRAGEMLGLEIEYREFPWKRMLASARSGQVDAVMPLFRTKEREQFLLFDDLAIAMETIVLFTWKQKVFEYNGDLSSIANLKIGVVAEYSYGEPFDNMSFPKKITTRNDQHLIEMFKHKRFDLGVGNRLVTSYHAINAGIGNQIRFLEPHITREELYLGFVKKSKMKEIAARFGQTLQKVKDSAEYKNILARYDLSP